MIWTDSLDIAIALDEAHPEIDPTIVNFVDLRQMVIDLEEFDELWLCFIKLSSW
jgi:FeS assembly protein IscX